MPFSIQDFMSGKTIFRNVMSILMLGVNVVMEERVNSPYGPELEEAILLSLELLLMALNKDALYVDTWRPMYQARYQSVIYVKQSIFFEIRTLLNTCFMQPVDAVLAHDNRQVVAILEYIRYDASQAIQQCSIRIMSILR
jgi:nuclear pore complex protein Nup205